jgi:peptidoglycan hydrolase-like protein with peptidoglycan-binding domain
LYNLNPKGTVSKNGINVPVILCHQDSYKLGLGSNHSDVYHWFNRYGKSMDTVRNDVANLMGGNFINTTTPSSSTAVKPSVPVGMLGLGSEGAEVKQLQENLMKLGYKLPKYGADGDFGDETLQAVLQFQKDKNIEQDGIVGPATKACITAAIKSLDNTPTVAPTPTPERPVIPEKLYYRVRKSWEDVASQVGAYLNLDNAIAAC